MALTKTYKRDLEKALRCAKTGSAYHWPTVADILMVEIERQTAEAKPSRTNDGLNAEEIKRQERERVWHKINKQIKVGDLQGDGCDETATRNGLIKATNIIFNMGI